MDTVEAAMSLHRRLSSRLDRYAGRTVDSAREYIEADIEAWYNEEATVNALRVLVEHRLFYGGPKLP